MFLFPDESTNSRNETAHALFMAPISTASDDPTGWLLGLEADCSTQVESCWMGNPKDYCVGVCADGGLEQCLMPDLTVGQCDQDGMQPDCAFRCADGSSSAEANTFCDDRTNVDMYMAGFTSMYNTKRACVVLFFQGWKLDRPWKFWLAMAGVLLMGAATQGLVALRPVVSKLTNGNRVVGSLLFGANASLGWFMMLVAMTFSTELFICATAGLIVGHYCFASANSSEILGTPCCNAVNGASSKVAVTGRAQAKPLLEGEAIAILSIEGMTCGSCTQTIATALRGVQGVLDASVSLQDGHAEVRYQQPAIPEQLIDAVDAVGFESKIVPSKPQQMVQLGK